MTASKKWLKIVLPPAVLIGSILVALLLAALRPEQEREEAVPIHPKVEIHTIRESNKPIVVESQGTARPRRQTRLTARVSGQIEEVSPEFYEGGSFAEGDLLVRLDPLPYRSALAEARSRLALAKATVIQEREAAGQAIRDWEAMGISTPPSPLVLREPQLMKAEADLEAAEVAVEMAEKNLSYTEIRAPYAGRVDAKYVDVGQAITAQATILGEIHAARSIEVPVPLSLDDLTFLELPETHPDAQPGAPGKPQARLTASVAGITHAWTGYLDRTAASVDSQSRMITAIVRMDAPFISDHGLELRPGMFVKVAIQGRPVGRVMEVPRAALHPGDVVYRLTDDARLESVSLDVLFTDTESAIVAEGLEPGDRICLTPLLFFVEGMHVEVMQDPSAKPEPAA